MAKKDVFLMDGIAYNVDVTKLTRKFSVLDSSKSTRTQDGEMYRDIVGTFYNYSMTVMERNHDAAALDAFWDAVSQPKASHVCVFPYGQKTLSQRMYVTGGEQELKMMVPEANRWGELNLEFVAMSPKVLP